MKHFKFLTWILLLFLITACAESPPPPSGQDIAKHQENLIRANKYLVANDADRIKAFAKRRNWEMKVSETGLWSMIYEQGKGQQAKTGKTAIMNYKVWLLDGTLCYSSDSLGPKKFRIGKGGVESGLEEGILLLHQGDKARFILPPHLAFGIQGDNAKIPRRSTIVYELELINITD